MEGGSAASSGLVSGMFFRFRLEVDAGVCAAGERADSVVGAAAAGVELTETASIAA